MRTYWWWPYSSRKGRIEITEPEKIINKCIEIDFLSPFPVNATY